MLRTICILFISWACVAAEIDATASWNSRQAIAVLAGLRAPLDAQPDDQHLLGQAIQAYLALSFSGQHEQTGQLGPWLAYAEKLAARRVALRQGKKVPSFAEAVPELWLLLVQGNTRAVVAGLAEWPASATDPHARALRAAATRDTTLFDQSSPQTALEWYGYLMACEGSRVAPQGLSGKLPVGVEPLVVAQVLQDLEIWQDLKIPARGVLADVAWMLNSAQAPEAIAIPRLKELITAVGGTVPEGADRAALVKAALLAIHHYDCQRAEPFISAWQACRDLRGGAAGITSADGKHLLVGISDVATWNLSRLYLASVMQCRGSGMDKRYATVVGAAMNAALPGTLIAARAHIGAGTEDPAIIQDLVDAIAKGLQPDSEIPAAIALIPIEWILTEENQAAKDLCRSIVSVAQPADGSGRQRGLHTLIRVCPRVGQVASLIPALQREFARDPYDQRLWRMVRDAGTSPILSLDGLTPALQRIEPQVDIKNVPISDSNLNQNIAGQWRGFLKIDTAEPIELGIESDDGSKLIVSDVVLTELGMHAMQLSSVTHAFATGWHPLRLDWFNGFGGGGIRLLWRRPGDTELAPIPASHLSHGTDHAPGLSATYWEVGDTLFTRLFQPTDQDLARVKSMPWLWPAHQDIGLAYAKVWKWSQALPPLALAKKHGVYDFQVNRGHLHAFARMDAAELQKPGQAAALVQEFKQLYCLQNNFRFAAEISTGLLKAHAEDIMGKTFRADFNACCVASWPIARLALARGDWAQAIRQSDALIIGEESLKSDEYRETRDLLKLEKVILQRIDGIEPQWADLHEFAMDNTATPYIRLYTRWFTGRNTWDEVMAKVPTTKDGDAVLWLRGLYDVSIGDVAAAQAGLNTLVAAQPRWFESQYAAGLLRWCAKQTPETIAAMKKATPVERGVRPSPPVEGGVNF